MSYSQLASRVNRILYDQWDPIGVRGDAPEDEYESYVPVLVRLARGEDAVAAIAAQLGTLESGAMGLKTSSDAHRRGVAEQVVAAVRASGWQPPAR
jgi:hypothetical protein